MRLLSIDPGITTGIAVYDEDGNLELSMTVSQEKIYKNGFMNKLVSLSQPSVVLIEDLPRSNVDSGTQELHSHFSSWFKVAGYEVERIKPAQWKGLAKRVEIPGQHARDAATMCRWYIDSHKNE